jgi:hypothetical protein
MEAPGSATTAILGSPLTETAHGSLLSRRPYSLRTTLRHKLRMDIRSPVLSRKRVEIMPQQPPASHQRGGQPSTYRVVAWSAAMRYRDARCGISPSLENIILFLPFDTSGPRPNYLRIQSSLHKERGRTRSTSTTKDQQPPHSSCLRLRAWRHQGTVLPVGPWAARSKPGTDGRRAACTSNLRGRRVPKRPLRAMLLPSSQRNKELTWI